MHCVNQIFVSSGNELSETPNMLVMKCISDSSSKPECDTELYVLMHSPSKAVSKNSDVLCTNHVELLCNEFSKVYNLNKGRLLEMKFLRGDSPLQFWIGDCYNHLLQVYLQRLKQKMIQGFLQPVDSNPKIGELIICETSTKSIIRGYVLNRDNNTITVINIDTGALHIVTSQDCWQIDGTFFSVPPQAICCKLWQVPDCIKWNHSLENIFRKLAECYLTVVLKDVMFEGILPYFIVDVNMTYKKGFTANLSVWTKFILNRIDIAEMFNFTHFKTLFHDLDLCVDHEETSSFDISNCFDSDSRKQVQNYKSEHSIIHTVLYCPVKRGTVFWTSLALKVGTPWNFYLNLEPMKSIENLKRIITQKGNNGLLTHFPTVPEVGNIAIGKCNDTFSRIRVTGFLRFSNMGNITAVDIDDGSTKILWAKDLWVLDEEFLSPPALALNCALSKYMQKPFYWNEKLQQQFKELMSKGVMKVSISDMLYVSGSFKYIVNIKIFADREYDVTEYIMDKYKRYVKQYKSNSFDLINKMQWPN